jgi:O-antigen ligase
MTNGQHVTTAGLNNAVRDDSLAGSIIHTEPREKTPWLLAFLCLLIPILPAFVVPAGPLKSNGSPAKVIAVLFFGLAVLGFILLRRTASTRTLRPGVVVILTYFLLQLAVYGVGITHTDSALVEANKTRALIILVASVGVALYILSRVRTTRQRKIVLGCLAIGLTFACLVGLLQALTNIDLRFLFQPPGFVKNIDADNLQLEQRLNATRVVGTSQHPIEFSVLAAATVPLTIYFARNAAKREVRWAALLACGLALVSMPAAGSRTGVVALVLALFVYMWSFKLGQLALGLVAGAAVVVIYVAVFPNMALALWHAITGAREDPSILGRIADYAQVSRTFRDNPVFGIGLGGAPPDEYGLLDNEWLRAIVQGGTVGVTAMIVLAGGGIFGLAAALRAATTRPEREQAYMLGSMFVAILSCSFTFDLFFYQQATLIFFIVFGLLWSSFTVPLSEGQNDAKRYHGAVGLALKSEDAFVVRKEDHNGAKR